MADRSVSARAFRKKGEGILPERRGGRQRNLGEGWSFRFQKIELIIKEVQAPETHLQGRGAPCRIKPPDTAKVIHTMKKVG